MVTIMAAWHALVLPFIISFLSFSPARAAINLDGTQAVEPAIGFDDPSPIDTPNTYYQEQHACPLPCADLANVHSWITYTSTTRLDRCDAPMLLQFSALQSVRDSPYTLIRSCTLASAPASGAAFRGQAAPGAASANTTSPLGVPYATDMENPKLSDGLFDVSINVAPACAAEGLPVRQDLIFVSTPETRGSASPTDADTFPLLQGIRDFFDNEDNCSEKFLFAKNNNAVAALYIGAGLGKPTIGSTLDALADALRDGAGASANRTAVELCGSDREPSRTFGIALDNSGNLAAVQALALGWSTSKCHGQVDDDLLPRRKLQGVRVFDIAGAGLDPAANSTATATANAFHSRFKTRHLLPKRRISSLKPRAVCDYLKVEEGDGCPSLAPKCGLTPPQFMRFNSQAGLCGNLRAGDYVCCSAGDPYSPPKPEVPKPQADGTCATHLIGLGDTCDTLGKRFGVTAADLEKWNKGRTWAWTKCSDMLGGYNMCISPGNPPLPPPQEGAQCGPMVPGTKPPASSSVSLADLNPCPLKVCCSNWGFCGVFPAHCTVHKVEGGGPGAKPKDIQSTCVSNCERGMVTEAEPPKTYGRVGYYESWNLGRDCLWLKAEDANTDGSYTHMHWGFIEIDPQTWKPVINDPHKQWAGFKSLPNMKRVASIGGWAYSTEPATYDILRRAIIDNRELFATNLAVFVKEENIDGIDIDWEYPGAPDIEVNGQVIGKATDGGDYLRFLSTLKQKLGQDKIVAIAAPASYWYLKAFPIDRIARFVDYIVYMTYDLHGQWDAGNPNAFDECDSGRCIRSHVNLTETFSALGMVTRAGVSSHKIFVGESSYGRSFHLAKKGCWGPLCDFTGSRTESDARPGRCTKTGGYLANAEINEIIKRGGSDIEVFRDNESGADVVLFDDNYVSFLTYQSKIGRRSMWQANKFAGTIDWAVDLQEFTDLDNNAPVERARDENDQVCTSGTSYDDNTGDMCEFTCAFGYCPESLCTCLSWGEPIALPAEKGTANIVGINEFDVEMNRLCKFGCRYGYCPQTVCTTPTDALMSEQEIDNLEAIQEYRDRRTGNARKCWVYEDPARTDLSVCKRICAPELSQDQEDGMTTNYGCSFFMPGLGPIPWMTDNQGLKRITGDCSCNNWMVNFFADTIVEALPAIGQIGCYIMMSTFKVVLDVGLSLFGAGRAISGAMDMMATAAQMINHFYDEGEDPLGAFEWWLWPCGGSNLVPDELKEVFDILNMVTDGISFREPKLKKGSGKKGDKTNPKPIDRKPPPSNGGSNGGITKTPQRCRIPFGQDVVILGEAKNTLRMQHCAGQVTVRQESVITSITYAPNAQPVQVRATCKREWAQACYHYSSVIRNNPSWATITCPQEAAKPKYRLDGPATDEWSRQRSGAGWLNSTYQPWVNKPQTGTVRHQCQRDEFPPAYLLNKDSEAWIDSGVEFGNGQLVRFLPHSHNSGGGSMWKSACFGSILRRMSVTQFRNSFRQGPLNKAFVNSQQKPGLRLQQFHGGMIANEKPEFTIVKWDQTPVNDDGLFINECWPDQIAPMHAGFVLLDYDPWNLYNELDRTYDYTEELVL